jgi:transposase
LSCPKIAIHKFIVKENLQQSRYVKRTQKDYTMSFKLQIVHEIEQGLTTISPVKKEYAIQTRSIIVQWLIKFGDFD